MLRITLSANGSLYCCSDGVRGRGAAVTCLSHNASFHSKEKIAPSNRGIKHLEGNGCVERFIRTLKEKLLWGRHFKTIKEFWLALL